MRFASTVTSVSWIPSEAVTGAFKAAFSAKVANYDDPPPDNIAGVESLRDMVAANRFRFANFLSAWIEVDDGRVVGHGVEGEGIICSTTLRLGVGSMTFAPTTFPSLRPAPEIGSDGSVRFTQTCGGRTGVPAPRPVKRPPFFQIAAPTAWTTLELVMHPDGRSHGQLIGASPFPRHWVYDSTGHLFQKSTHTDFKKWKEEYFGDKTPWGAADSPAMVRAVESALERQLSLVIMREGEKPRLQRLAVGEDLCVQGTIGRDLYLLLDGVLEVVQNGGRIAEIGPGAVVGELAFLEAGVRTATLRALMPCRVAVVSPDKIDRARLAELAGVRQRLT